MNLFRDLALWLVSLLPPGAPEWAIGSAVFIAIFGPVLMLIAVGALAATLIERTQQP